MAGMVHGLSNADPELATRFVLDLAATGDGKADWMIGIVTGKVLGAEGPAGAATWAQDLPPGSVRAEALEPGRARLRHAATRRLPSHGSSPSPPAETRRAGMQSAFSTWAERDPGAPASISTRCPPPRTATGPSAATLPASPTKTRPAALEWVESINDPGVREQTLIRTAQVFYHHGDRQAVREWLPNSGLSPEAQQQVLNHRGRRR